MNPLTDTVEQLMRGFDRAPEQFAAELGRLMDTSPDAQAEVAQAVIELLDNPGVDWQTGLTVLGDSGSPELATVGEGLELAKFRPDLGRGARRARRRAVTAGFKIAARSASHARLDGSGAKASGCSVAIGGFACQA